MVEQVTGGKALPPEVVQQIVSKTDGVPLFVEELTKTVVESGLVEKPMATMSSRRAAALRWRFPPRSGLADGPAGSAWPQSKEIAQLGATIGREFSL